MEIETGPHNSQSRLILDKTSKKEIDQGVPVIVKGSGVHVFDQASCNIVQAEETAKDVRDQEGDFCDSNGAWHGRTVKRSLMKTSGDMTSLINKAGVKIEKDINQNGRWNFN